MSIQNTLIESLKETTGIVLIIFFLMILIELFVLKYKEKILSFIKKNKFLEYTLSSFFGIIPGCVGTFAMDSLYMAGLLSFGGIVAVMISTSGDEAFLLFSLAIKNTIGWSILLLLIGALFFIGIFGGYLADKFKKRTKMEFCKKCEITNHKHKEFKMRHFLVEHIYNHIIKKHIFKIFIWIFIAIFLISLFNDKINLVIGGLNPFVILILASLIALFPISGPNVFLVIMFSQGLIPFSILLANSIIQDGHGLLPILGFSMTDALKIKLFNFIIGISFGIVLLLLGL